MGDNDTESEDDEERGILDELKLKRQRAEKAEMKTYKSLMNMGPHQQTKKMEMLYVLSIPLDQVVMFSVSKKEFLAFKRYKVLERQL